MNEIVKKIKLSGNCTLEIVKGDITQERVDAIVNAANEHLAHGGGVAAAIVREGGSIIQQESNQWVRKHGTVSHSQPAYTSAGNLPCRFVIHAVGPRWGEGDEDEKLFNAVKGSLQLADKLQLKSLAFPAISTGIFGFPVERAAGVLFRAFKSYFIEFNDSGVTNVRLTLYDQPTLDSFLQVFNSNRDTMN